MSPVRIYNAYALLICPIQTTVTCEVCGIQIGRKTDLKRHMVIHSQNKEDLYVDCSHIFVMRLTEYTGNIRAPSLGARLKPCKNPISMGISIRSACATFGEPQGSLTPLTAPGCAPTSALRQDVDSRPLTELLSHGIGKRSTSMCREGEQRHVLLMQVRRRNNRRCRPSLVVLYQLWKDSRTRIRHLFPSCRKCWGPSLCWCPQPTTA